MCTFNCTIISLGSTTKVPIKLDWFRQVMQNNIQTVQMRSIVACSSCVSTFLLVSSLSAMGIACVLSFISTSIIVYNMDWNEVMVYFCALKAEWYSLILTKYFLTHLNVYFNQLNISFGIQLLAGRLEWMVGLGLILGVVLSIAGRINRCIHHRDYVVSTGIVNILVVVSNIDEISSGCAIDWFFTLRLVTWNVAQLSSFQCVIIS